MTTTSDDKANGDNNDNPVDNHQDDDDHQDDENLTRDKMTTGNDTAKRQQLATTRRSDINWQRHGKAMTTGIDKASKTAKEKI